MPHMTHPQLNAISSTSLTGHCQHSWKMGEVDWKHAHMNMGELILSSERRRAYRMATSGEGRRGPLHIVALDAAMPFDLEHKLQRDLASQGKLKIGILGFGNFGQFLAKRFRNQMHDVIAFSRSDYRAVASQLGVNYFRSADDFCEEHPDVVVLSCSILSTREVLLSLPMQRLRRNTLFVDVLSVKEYPKCLLLQLLPPEFDILCTHPMFGPDSGRGSWKNLPFVYEKVRIGSGPREKRCEHFLNTFENEGCRMVEMSCEEHDRFAAGSQFVTHTVGRVLSQLALESTPINTKGYESLLHLVSQTENDSFDLYYGLFMYNFNATEELQRLESAFETVRKQLFDRLHTVLRREMFDMPGATAATHPLPLPPPSPPKIQDLAYTLPLLPSAAAASPEEHGGHNNGRLSPSSTVENQENSN